MSGENNKKDEVSPPSHGSDHHLMIWVWVLPEKKQVSPAAVVAKHSRSDPPWRGLTQPVAHSWPIFSGELAVSFRESNIQE